MTSYQDPSEIYLQPWCDKCERDPGDGRMWAPDDPWIECDCGRKSVRYVMAKPGRVMVPDNDWAVMARAMSLPVEDQKKIMEIMDDMLSRKE